MIAIVKYLPVEGEIKEGEFVHCPMNPSEKPRFVTKLNNDRAKTFTDDGLRSGLAASPSCHIENYCPRKLFAVTQDIEVGKWCKFLLVSGSIVDAKVKDIDYEKDRVHIHYQGEKHTNSRIVSLKDVVKVLGELSPDATWVKDREEIEVLNRWEYHDEIEDVEIGAEAFTSASYPKDKHDWGIVVKCPTCNTYH